VTVDAEDSRPERPKKVRVRVDADLLREAREVLGARTNSEAAELAMTIALAIREARNADTSPNMKRLGSDQFKV
jgi:Arc/MetJ family transcription regulator